MNPAATARRLKSPGEIRKYSTIYHDRLRSARGTRAVLSGLENLVLTGSPYPSGRNIANDEVIVLKDNFLTTDLPTTCASHILEGFRGSATSMVGRLLQDAGIHIVAKTNMDEFGMGSYSTNSARGPVKHGFDSLEQSVGGSSGGSALVVAGGLARFAIGSDTGGSVRLPAAYTGILGFKPSYGRISRNGLIPYANSLDTVGIMSTSVKDAISIYRILNKYDPADPTSLDLNSRARISHAGLSRSRVPDHEASNQVGVRVIGLRDKKESARLSLEAGMRWKAYGRQYLTKRSWRIGVPDEYNIQEMHPWIRIAWLKTLSVLQDMGNDIVHISLPTTQSALSAYYVLAPAEASSNLAKYDGVRYGIPRDAELADNHEGVLYAHHRGQHFGDEVKRRILLGTFSLSAGAMDNYFIQAQKVRRLVQQDFNNVFTVPHPLLEASTGNPEGVDFIVVPTAPTLPPLLSELKRQSPLDSYINDIFTVPASLAGLPAISVPVVADDDLPPTSDKNIGMQIIGQFGEDMPLLNFARDTVEAIDPPRPRETDSRIWTARRF
ncbi:Trimeric GatFAB AmidoTransferase(AdT) complex subunit [Lithohypha guttulata]|uniref:Glutamyl-tRNA(Gln) amidotransferase subunit A, mitochondrial n=1 Tax=Lithohypha guttulata TaxID=1690604 RepID=A0AAN7SUG2_9EURO|nr:Trimeric GatFAB AmidoTransferase(AdT) complex subunit [Lithohypha guttulata]